MPRRLCDVFLSRSITLGQVGSTLLLDMIRLLKFVEGVFLSLLPEGLQRGWQAYCRPDYEMAASVSGMLESVLACGVLLWRYVHFLPWRAQQLNALSGGRLALANEGTQLYFHGVLALEYLLQPLTLLLLWLAVEGAVRAVVAGFADEVLPSAWLKLAGLALLRRRARAEQRRQLLPDEVTRPAEAGVALCIRSAAAKPWFEGMTLEFEGGLLLLKSARRAPSAERGWIYDFVPQPEGVVIRRLERYAPPPGDARHG